MKTMRLTLCLVSVLPLLLVGCSADDANSVVGDPTAIRLNGGIAVSALAPDTRGAGMVNGKDTWTTDLSVNFARADADEDANYTTGYLTGALNATLAKAPSNGNHAVTFTPTAYYQPVNKTKLIGWHPATGGTFDATAHTVTYSTALDGSTDLMATDLYEGSKSSNIGTVTFRHLLTQISVKVYSADANTAAVWGGIKSVKIAGKSQTCVVTLPAATASITGGTEKATAAFSGTDALNLVKKSPTGNTDITYSDVAPLALGVGSSNAALAGYAMFAPVVSGSITLTIDTEKGGEQTATVNAPAGGFAAGTSYIVTLKFGGTDVEPAVTITDWVLGTDPGEVIL